VRLRAPGSGGYGLPAERDPARLRDDVINGYVSGEAALGDYGHAGAAGLVCPACGTPPRGTGR
jgi:N-methylhydantoinase B/oxoprolinase/acetone carboxylase alpha subunit